MVDAAVLIMRFSELNYISYFSCRFKRYDFIFVVKVTHDKFKYDNNW